LHVDDEIGLFDAAAQTGVFFSQALILTCQRVGGGLTALFLGIQRFEFALLLLAPGDQMAGIQTLTAHSVPDGAVIAASLGLRHDGALVLGREVAALRFSWTSGSGMVAGAAAPELVAPNAGAAVGTPNLSCYLGVYRLEGTRSHSLPRN